MRIIDNHWSDLVLILALLMMTSAAIVDATETRVGSMGGIGFYTRDNSNVFYFPGTIYQYRNQFIGELRTKNIDDSYSIGVHFPLGPQAVIGTYLNSPMQIDFSEAVSGMNVSLDRTTDLFYGSHGRDYDFGAKLSIASDGYSTDGISGDVDESAFYVGLAGGVSNDRMDAALMFDVPRIKREVGTAEEKQGGFGFGANGRLFMERMSDMTLVPLGRIYYGTYSYEYDSGQAGVEKDKTDIGLLELGFGVGLNYQLNEDNLVVLAFEGLGLSKFTEDEKGGTKTTERRTTMPGIYMGLESAIRPWLVGRLGAAQVYQSIMEKIEPQVGTSTESTTRESSFKMMFGLGLSFGDFELDASVNEGLLFDGPNFLSGSDEPMAYRLSVTYRFDSSPAEHIQSQPRRLESPPEQPPQQIPTPLNESQEQEGEGP